MCALISCTAERCTLSPSIRLCFSGRLAIDALYCLLPPTLQTGRLCKLRLPWASNTLVVHKHGPTHEGGKETCKSDLRTAMTSGGRGIT